MYFQLVTSASDNKMKLAIAQRNHCSRLATERAGGSTGHYEALPEDLSIKKLEVKIWSGVNSAEPYSKRKLLILD